MRPTPVAYNWLYVVDPGPLTTVQDRGRRGYAHLGVPRAGAADQPAADLANRLVGNELDDAVLEVTLGGLSLRTERAVRVAVTGAPCEVYVDHRHHGFGHPVVVPAGATLRLGPATSGLRTYLGVAGGVLVPATLGSRSTDTLGGLGPAPLALGDRLPVGEPPPAPAVSDVVVMPPREATVQVDLGPRTDWFDPQGLARLDGATYVVAADSDRVALRLQGVAVPWRPVGVQAVEFATEPLVLGAVHVPSSGQPLVFLADHPTTGGYPVLGVVRSRDLSVCAQLRPGETVTLHLARQPRL